MQDNNTVPTTNLKTRYKDTKRPDEKIIKRQVKRHDNRLDIRKSTESRRYDKWHKS